MKIFRNFKIDTRFQSIQFVLFGKRFFYQTENGKKLRQLVWAFRAFFQGDQDCGLEPVIPQLVSSLQVTDFKLKDGKLIVTLCRPGLLIGRGGNTIDSLQRALDCKISIVESNLWG